MSGFVGWRHSGQEATGRRGEYLIAASAESVVTRLAGLNANIGSFAVVEERITRA